MDDERRSARMAAALKVAEQMQATRRFDPPPADEADAWSPAFHDEDDESGRTVVRGRPVWHRKDLCDEWNRLRFTDEGKP